MSVWRRPIVGVMGSGTSTQYSERAEEIGKFIAEEGWHLLTGGGKGLMEVTAKAFVETTNRKGLSLGIIPSETLCGNEVRADYPNDYVEMPIMTHLTIGDTPTDITSRNHINVLTSNVIIFLPGCKGTAGELALARQYRRPHIAFIPQGASIGDETWSQVRLHADDTDHFADVRTFLYANLGAETQKMAC